MNNKEVMQMALEALKNSHPYSNSDRDLDKHSEAITALRKALEQPEQEPGACRFCHSEKGSWAWQCYDCGEIDDVQKPTPSAAKPEQEPVADGNKVICPACCHQFRAIPTAVQTLMLNAGFEPPFVTPPATERKPLTDEEIEKLYKRSAGYGGDDFHSFARAIEAAHNIKEQP